MFRFYIERVAFIGFLMVAAYGGIISVAIFNPAEFEAFMLAVPPIGLVCVLFCLNYLGMPVPFKGLFELQQLPRWAEKQFSWKRFFMEFVYTALIWLVFAAIAFARALPKLL